MKLRVGQFYGAPLQTRTVPGFVLSEVCYGPGMVLPKHSHEQAYFSFLWRGGSIKKSAGVACASASQGQQCFIPRERCMRIGFLGLADTCLI
jgi:hypothetical protein